MPARAPHTNDTPSGTGELMNVVSEDELSLQAAERAMLERALRKANGNKVRAARLLGLGKSTQYRKLQAHRIR
jgi:transcriptional regulator of acetoin/glycerol metabolism